MATWTHLLASAMASTVVRHICSSGTKIYYIDHSTNDVYEYDPGTNTETLILDASAIGSYGTTYAITWFNDDLYVMNEYGGAPKVERWDGTPNDLTTVKTFTLNGGPTQTGLLSDTNTIVAFTVTNPTSPAAYSAECWYSSSGSSWSAGSWDNAVWSPPDLNGVFDAPRNTAFPTGLFREFVTTTDAGRTTTTQKCIFEFVGGVWIKGAVLNTAPGEIYNFSSPNEAVHWTHTTGQYYDSAFAGTTTIGSSPRQTHQVNMPYSVAISLAPPVLYEYSGGAWVLLDTLNASWDLDSNAKAIVRLDNGDVYMVAYSSIGAGYDVRIFVRDTPIDPPAAVKFYQGIDSLAFKSDIPVAGVDPGGLAVSLGGLAFVGSNGPSGQMVVRAASPYTAWTDLSGSIPNTAGVRTLHRVPQEVRR
jgi:hypothetical protein